MLEEEDKGYGWDFLIEASEPRSLDEVPLVKLGLASLLPPPKLFLGAGFTFVGSLNLVLVAPVFGTSFFSYVPLA